MLPYFLCFLGGYLVGSIPTGYLLVKRQSNIDISESGSGNVGAFNAGVVTGSKRIGITVGLIDGFKGVLAVILAGFWSFEFSLAVVALLASVIGHNYSVWLKFKGGRGLATACGGMLLVSGGYVLVWCTIWAVLKWQKQTILAANLLAIVATPVVLLLLPGASLEAVSALSGNAESIRWLGAALSALLIVSHLDAFREATQKIGD